MCSPHICKGRVLGLVLGVMEGGQKGHGEECVPEHVYESVYIEEKGHFKLTFT